MSNYVMIRRHLMSLNLSFHTFEMELKCHLVMINSFYVPGTEVC